MAYVDLRRRRGKGRGAPGRSWRGLFPHLLLLAGLVLAVPVVTASSAALVRPSEPWAAPLGSVGAAVLLFYAAWMFRRPRGVGRAASGSGAEKLLLVAIRDSGGAITAVGAALETPLALDEAEELLLGLASAGHLRVEGHDGTL